MTRDQIIAALQNTFPYQTAPSQRYFGEAADAVLALLKSEQPHRGDQADWDALSHERDEEEKRADKAEADLTAARAEVERLKARTEKDFAELKRLDRVIYDKSQETFEYIQKAVAAERDRDAARREAGEARAKPERANHPQGVIHERMWEGARRILAEIFGPEFRKAEYRQIDMDRTPMREYVIRGDSLPYPRPERPDLLAALERVAEAATTWLWAWDALQASPIEFDGAMTEQESAEIGRLCRVEDERQVALIAEIRALAALSAAREGQTETHPER